MLLVTGSSGFIGKHLMVSLLQDHASVYALSRTALPEELTGGRVRLIQGDITGEIKVPPDVRTIYHCAGALRQEDQMVRVNVDGTRNIAQAALRQGCRLIHLSSAGVIGRYQSRIIDETSECSPRNLYEKTKYDAEKIIREFTRDGLDARVLRPTIVFGVRNDIGEDGFFQLLRSMAIGTYRHVGGGNGTYNIVHVNEVVRAMRMLDVDAIGEARLFFVNTPTSFKTISGIVSEEVSQLRTGFRNIPFAPAFCAAACFSLLSLLRGRRIALTLSRLKALTNRHVFSQTLLESTGGYRPLKGVEEYVREVCRVYYQRGLLN